MNNAVFEKTMENVRDLIQINIYNTQIIHRNIKLVTTKAERNYLLSEPEVSYNKNFDE